MPRLVIFLLSLLGCFEEAKAQSASSVHDFEEQIGSVVGDKRMTVGVAFSDGTTTLTYNESDRFPLLSVFKLHVAVAVLMRMQADGIPLDRLVCVSRSRLHTDTYSPMLRECPAGDFRIGLEKLLAYSVSQSDNNAADLLIDYVGGIDSVAAAMRRIGLTDFALTETEASMHEDLSHCYNNRSTPLSVVRLLQMVFNGTCLSGEYQRCLRCLLFATTTGRDKIRAGLPVGAFLAHKTGSSDRIDGVKIADNDAGAIRLSDGRTFYLAVFIMESRESDTTNAAVMAEIAARLMASTSLFFKGYD